MQTESIDSEANPRDRIRHFIRTEILESPDEVIEDDTPLISDGYMNSLSTLKVVSFLEETFDVQLAAHEISVDYLDSINQIVATVEEKLGS